MTAKAKVYWSIWIGIWTGIYVLLYLLSPLAKHGIIWVTFIALPIYFNGGALRKDYIPQMICSCVGVIWGVIMFAGADFMTGAFGLASSGSTALSCGVFTITCCMMMILKDNSMLNKVPAMFGGISACFSQGAATDKLIPLMITLCLGVTLGLICNEGGSLCEKWGADK
ncbi:MAG: DUF1097 domain-containing protein [Clostridiales bacterium]|nr:DUF1097 domain-containing protein [Clostridiales bacterium]